MNNTIMKTSFKYIKILLLCLIFISCSEQEETLSNFKPHYRRKYAYVGHNDNFFRGYVLQKKLIKINGDNIFIETTSGTLESLYGKLNIEIHDNKATLDSLGNTIYYLGSNDPPEPFRNKWGHFVLYSWGRDNKRDTYLNNWKDIPCWNVDTGNEDGDYIIYSDRIDFQKIKDWYNTIEYSMDKTTELITVEKNNSNAP